MSAGLDLHGVISIHPPRAGRDGKSRARSQSRWSFQSTLPVRGGTHIYKGIAKKDIFQSTLPVRGGTFSSFTALNRCDFNPPSPCGEGLSPQDIDPIIRDFNPPSPCGEGRGSSSHSMTM